MVVTSLSFFTARSLFYANLLFRNRITFFFNYQSLRYDDLFELRKAVNAEGWTLLLVQKDIFLYEPMAHLSSVLSRCTAVLYASEFVSTDKDTIDKILSFFTGTGFHLNGIKVDNYLYDFYQFEFYLSKSMKEMLAETLGTIANFLGMLLKEIVYFFERLVFMLSNLTFSFGYLVNINANF